MQPALEPSWAELPSPLREGLGVGVFYLRPPCGFTPALTPPHRAGGVNHRQRRGAARLRLRMRPAQRLSGIGGVPCVWKLSMVFRPQAWPFLRSISVQVTVW